MRFPGAFTRSCCVGAVPLALAYWGTDAGVEGTGATRALLCLRCSRNHNTTGAAARLCLMQSGRGGQQL